jgi:hypothetical protein
MENAVTSNTINIDVVEEEPEKFHVFIEKALRRVAPETPIVLWFTGIPGFHCLVGAEEHDGNYNDDGSYKSLDEVSYIYTLEFFLESWDGGPNRNEQQIVQIEVCQQELRDGKLCFMIRNRFEYGREILDKPVLEMLPLNQILTSAADMLSMAAHEERRRVNWLRAVRGHLPPLINNLRTQPGGG